MKNYEMISFLEDKLENKFVEDKNKEWVDIYITPKNSIDIKIVSNHIGSRKEAKSYIKNLIADKFPKYKMGMMRTYSVEESIEYEFTKNPKKNRPSNLAEAVDYMNNSYETTNNTQFNSEVISFYSYKGGVGRTLSLIHTSYLLAKKGKNVLMIDLDIEAPSMQNIFKYEMEEIKFGLVDYLYNKIHEKCTDKNIEISDIYTKIEGNDNENISGNLYFIPAGKLNTEYIYKLSKIRPNLVSRNNYISDIIKNLESKQELNLDFVLVDSRTGINDWGGVSLIDISDRVIFFVYPNYENVEGLKVLINLVDKSKSGNISVVFSRVDVKDHDSAVRFYEKFKNEFNLKHNYIELTYDPSIAISKNFPIKKMLEQCESVVDMILSSYNSNQNKNLFNSIYDEYSEKKSVLDMLEKRFDVVNVVEYDTINREKIKGENISLIFHKSQDLLNQYTKLLSEIDDKTKDENRVFLYINILDNHLFNSLNTYIDLVSWEDILKPYIMKILIDNNSEINTELEDKPLFSDFDKEKVSNLIGLYQKLISYEFKKKINDEEIRACGGILFFGGKICILVNAPDWLNDNIIWNCLDGLKSVKEFFENNNIKIDIKIFKSNDGTISNSIPNRFKSNVLSLDWKKYDIENYILSMLYKYIKIDDIENTESFTTFRKIMEMITNRDKKMTLNLFWGNKITENGKEIDILDYFCDNLKKYNRFNIIDANKILRKAITIEKNKKENMMDGQIISESSLKEALKSIESLD